MQSHEEDIDTEVLFNDRITVVAGLENPWSRRRKVHLSELADEPWVLPPADTPVGVLVAELFRARGLTFAPRGMARGSVHLVCSLVASGPFLGLMPDSSVALWLKSSAVQDFARKIVHPAFAGRDHDPQESNDQPGGATIHRSHPRTREAAGEAKAIKSCPDVARSGPPETSAIWRLSDEVTSTSERATTAIAADAPQVSASSASILSAMSIVLLRPISLKCRSRKRRVARWPSLRNVSKYS